MNAYVGTISYGIAAAAFLFLALLLIFSWRGRLPGLLLGAAAVISSLWAGMSAYDYWTGAPGSRWADSLEVVRTITWFAFLSSLLTFSSAAGSALTQRARWLGMVIAAVCLVLLGLALFLPDVVRATHLVYVALSRVLLAVLGLAILEQVYRNAHTEQRWGIKYLCLGLGGMFAYDFYLYSDAMLFRHFDADVWAARGVVNALIVPLIAVSAARNPSWSLDVTVSRRVLFHSTTLVGAGVYLLLTAAAGYYLQIFGGNWGRVFQATFLFASMVALISLLISGTLRARIKVFLSKNFFTYKYDYREEWLRFTSTLSGGQPGEDLRERSIQAVAELVESPGGALWLAQDGSNFEVVAHWNMPGAAGVEPVSGGFCKFLEQRQWVINLEEYQDKPELTADVVMPQWLGSIARAWLVVPLILHERMLGFMVLVQSRGDVPFHWEVSDLLKTAGRQAASYLAHIEATKALTVARQFESFTRTTTFVVHDLKNLVAQLSLLLTNAEKHKRNPAFVDDMVETVDNAVKKMQRLLTQLRSGSPELEHQLPIDLVDVLKRIVTAKSRSQPRPALSVAVPSLCVRADAERLERVLGHLVQNAIEATPPDGWVNVSLRLLGEKVVVEIADNGRGMSSEFIREQLYQPFETTKSAGMGIGVYETREYVRELGGQIEVTSEQGRGTRFSVTLPVLSVRESYEKVIPLVRVK